MTRILNFFLIIGLLGAQILTSAHAAQYGADAHEHSGEICQIYLQRDHQDYDVPHSLPALSDDYDVTVSIAPLREIQIAPQAHRLAAPRAPPASA